MTKDQMKTFIAEVSFSDEWKETAEYLMEEQRMTERELVEEIARFIAELDPEVLDSLHENEYTEEEKDEIKKEIKERVMSARH